MARLDELLKQTPGLGYIEGIEAELLVDDAFFPSQRGGDPTGALARAVPMLDRAERAAPDDTNLVVARSIAGIAEARWRISRGRGSERDPRSVPSRRSARSERARAAISLRSSSPAPRSSGHAG